MAATEFQWKTDDNLTIYGKDWSVSNPNTVFCLVHGMGEHINRYDHLAAFLNKKNIALIGNDHRGHGKSEGKRGHFRNYDDYLNEVDVLMSKAKKRYPNVPLVLYGHSKGGGIVLNYLVRRKPNLKAAIVTGPWIELAFAPNALMVFLGKMMRNIAPSFSQPSGLNVNDISRSKEEVAKYAADPLVHGQISAKAGMGLMDAGKYLKDYKGDIPCPLLIMHGSEDKLTSQPASEAFANQITSEVTYKKWNGFFHEIHNEPEQQEVFDYLFSWFEGV